MGTGYVSPWQSFWHDQNDDDYVWALVFILLPRKTEYNTWIWFSKAYRGMRVIRGPGEAVILDKWFTPEEFTWYQLTLNID